MSPEQKIKEEYLSEEFIMEFTGYSKKSLQTLRSAGSNKVPPSKKVGARYAYPVKDFQAWVNKQPTRKGVA